MADRKARERGIERAYVALAGYDDVIEAKVTDLLTDLMHLCAVERINFDRALESARSHREEEKG